jgi:hypothetical protein
MTGIIKTRHLMSQSCTIVREFGVRCYLRCVWRTMTAHRPVTFLECADMIRPRRPAQARRDRSSASHLARGFAA